jgi:hypothetical protein
MTGHEKELSRRDFVGDAGTLALGAIVAPHLRWSLPRGAGRDALLDEQSQKASPRTIRRTLLAADTFSAPDNTSITARVCDTGQAWTKTTDSDAANLIIVGSQAQLSGLCSARFSRYVLGVSLGSADYSISGTLKTITNAQDSYVGLFLRSSGSDYYELRRDAGQFEWWIGRYSGGVETTLATTSGIPASGTNDINVSFSVVTNSDGSVDLAGTISIPAYTFSTPVSFHDVDLSRILATGLPGIGIAEFGSGPLHAWDDIQVNGTPGTGTNFAKHDFNNGSLSPFWDPWGGSTIPNDPTGSGRGKVVQIDYVAVSGNSWDSEHAITPPAFGRGLGQDLWAQWDVHIPAGSLDGDGVSFRKLNYFQHQWQNAGDCISTLILLERAGGLDVAQAVSTGPSGNLSGYHGYSVAAFALGAWHTVKVHLTLETALGAGNGILQVWVDGTQCVNLSNIVYVDPLITSDGHGGAPTAFAFDGWNVGQQLQTVRTDAVESRYVDNVSFASTEGAL